MATHTFSRQELYDLVWSEPMAKLATRFGISGRGLAKACEKADIPVPERGYWARVQAGRPAAKPPLPRPGPKTPAQVTINPPGARTERPAPPPPPSSVQEKIEAELRPGAKVTVPKTLTADSDRTGHLFRFEGGHPFRSDAGRRSDLMPAT